MITESGFNTITTKEWLKTGFRYKVHYCTISIDSSVTRHGGYLTCRNIGCVKVSRRALTKGQKMWQTSLQQFWSKFGHFVRKRVNLASAAARRCMFHLKLSQKLLKYPASVWHLTKSGPCHTPKSQVTKWKFRQACHGVTWATNRSKLYSILKMIWNKYNYNIIMIQLQ